MTFRLIYMGTPGFAVPALQALHAAGHDIAAVYTQPPRPAGRGKRVQPSAVHQCAESLGLKVCYPLTLKSPDAQQDMAAFKAELAIVAAYGLILPQAVLDLFARGCLNIHGSLLPRWRGAAPIQRAIEAGDTVTGITIMQMEAGLDTGPMALTEAVSIDDQTTADMLHDRLAQCGADLMTRALDQLGAGSLDFSPQDNARATYAAKLDKAEAALNFAALDAAQMVRKINALSPWPGGYVQYQSKRIKLLKAKAVSASGTPGAVLDDALTIACRQGAIQPTWVQPAGKPAMDIAAFLRGRAIPAGTVFLP
ncbi:MAG: methionyl-tRNA formyltransferase [Pseudomonadota bacterium]